MADNTAIAWTDHTLNPWMGCFKVSAGCKNCYADELTTKRMNLNVFGPPAPEGQPTRRKRTGPGIWNKPIKWNRDAEEAGELRRVFCASLSDVFEDEVGPNEWRPEVFELIKKTPWLDYQLLTKRPENLARMLPDDWGDGYPNVWLGTSIEDQRVAERAPILTAVPAVVHFVSYEPALGPLELDLGVPGGMRCGRCQRSMPGSSAYDGACDCGGLIEAGTPGQGHMGGIEWMIFGGESGPGYRSMDLQWARDMQTACFKSGAAFFFKQSAAPRTEMGIDALGGIVREFPLDRTPRVAMPVAW